MAEFLSQHPQSFCIIAGEGQSKSQILDIFNRHGVGDRLRLTGIASGDKLADAYNSMDVFAFASKSETQGMVLTEAMAAGVPVVAIDAPGAREVVVDGKNGRLLPEENFDSFLFALNGIHALSSQYRCQLKEAARLTAKKFSLGVTTRKAMALYRQEIKRSQRTCNRPQLSKLFRVMRKELEIGKNWTRSALEAMREH